LKNFGSALRLKSKKNKSEHRESFPFSLCKEKIGIFGVSNIDDVASHNGIEVLAKVPLISECMVYGKGI